MGSPLGVTGVGAIKRERNTAPVIDFATVPVRLRYDLLLPATVCFEHRATGAAEPFAICSGCWLLSIGSLTNCPTACWVSVPTAN